MKLTPVSDTADTRHQQSKSPEVGAVPDCENALPK